MTSTVICTQCPKGCRMRVAETAEGYAVQGSGCDNGRVFAVSEIENPQRILTTTVEVIGGTAERLPVRSASPVSRQQLPAFVKIVRELKIHAPVEIGSVILADIGHTGIDIVASTSVAAR